MQNAVNFLNLPTPLSRIVRKTSLAGPPKSTRVGQRDSRFEIETESSTLAACNALRRRRRPSRRRLRRFSTKLWPLESEDEIALLLGMARYPVDTPDRAEVIAADMQTKHASTTINVLVSSIESEAGISALVDLLDPMRSHEQEKSTPLHLVP